MALCAMTMTTSAQATSPRPVNVPYSIRLEDQFLATLRYLPVTFIPTVTTPTTTTTTTTSTTTTTLVSPTTDPTSTTTSTTTTTVPIRVHKTVSPLKLVSGSFVWRFDALPAVLRAQWRVGTYNVVLQGALMRFQSVHGLFTTGMMNGDTWHALTRAVLEHQFSSAPYDDVLVSTALPERLKLYQNGRVTFSSLVNTGISEAPTVAGTYPVYLRFTSTTMSGVLPDGTPYHDTGIPWVSYFNGGDALHGFIRSSYGWPQSLGCVEMPFVNAAALWPHTPIGTLVTVQ